MVYIHIVNSFCSNNSSIYQKVLGTTVGQLNVRVPTPVLVGSCCLQIRLQTPVVLLLWGELPK